MNPQMQTETQRELLTYSDIALSETDLLVGWGFDAHEIASLLWLRQWYQTGGSDRATWSFCGYWPQAASWNCSDNRMGDKQRFLSLHGSCCKKAAGTLDILHHHTGKSW